MQYVRTGGHIAGAVQPCALLVGNACSCRGSLPTFISVCSFCYRWSLQEVPVLLRLLSLHCLCVPLVLILDECQYAGDRDWTLIQSVSNALVEQVGGAGICVSCRGSVGGRVRVDGTFSGPVGGSMWWLLLGLPCRNARHVWRVPAFVYMLAHLTLPFPAVFGGTPRTPFLSLCLVPGVPEVCVHRRDPTHAPSQAPAQLPVCQPGLLQCSHHAHHRVPAHPQHATARHGEVAGAGARRDQGGCPLHPSLQCFLRTLPRLSPVMDKYGSEGV